VARIRTIKPEFFTSIPLSRLSLGARLTFIGLWTYCDDDGRARDEPRLVKAAIWPLEDNLPAEGVDVQLDELADAGLIQRYAVDGERYLAIKNWKEHQRIDKPKESKLPAPPTRRATDPEPPKTHPRLIPETSTREGKGKEGKGTDQGKTSSASTSWPAEFAKAYEPIGLLNPGQVGRLLKPVVTRYGVDRTREMWAYYIRHAPHTRFGKLDPETRDTSRMNPADFVRNAGTWYAKTQPLGGPSAVTAS
jgi:hypothetical protein